MTASKRQTHTPLGLSMAARLAKLEATSIQQANVINLLTLRLRDVYQWAQASSGSQPDGAAPLIIMPGNLRTMDAAQLADMGGRGFPKELLDAELDVRGG